MKFVLLLILFGAAGFSCSKPKDETALQNYRSAAAAPAAAQQTPAENKRLPLVLRRVENFSAELKQFEAQAGRQALEPLFQKGESVAAALEGVIDVFKEEYYVFAKNNMRGYLVSRELATYAVPDVKFFRELAERRGEKTDVAFFQLLAQSRPDNLLPAYVKKTSAFDSCIRFGDGKIVALYAKWMEFKNRHPSAYVKQTDEMLQAIGMDLTMSVCACGNEEEVLKEFRMFIAKFPGSAITPQLKKRMENIQKKIDPMRFHCTGG